MINIITNPPISLVLEDSLVLDTYDKAKKWLGDHVHRNFFPRNTKHLSVHTNAKTQHTPVFAQASYAAAGFSLKLLDFKSNILIMNDPKQ